MVPAKFVIGKRLRQDASREDDIPESLRTSDSARASWKTLSNRKSRHMSYRARMTLMFASIAAMTAVILVTVLGVNWEAQFMHYTRSNMDRYAAVIADGLAEDYDPAIGLSGSAVDRIVQASSISSEIGVQVLDGDGNIVYDDTWAGGSRETAVTLDAATDATDSAEEEASAVSSSAPAHSNAVSLAPTDAESVVMREVKLEDGSVIGTVSLWAFGSAARTGIVGDDEIGQLGETFDDMATTLERDLKLEHRLTSDVAHELRTPLMAMLATVEAMQDGVLPSDEEHLETVASEVRRLSRLVSAMLTLSRIENGTAPFRPERTEMVGLVRSVVESQEQLFNDRGLRLRFDANAPRGELYCECDRDMIRQALINLMSNALRYTPENGWVVVNVGQEGRDLKIAVSDTGIGIAKEDLARVFSRFWRSDASRERASGGLGVGLSVTKEIIDRHHGYISVESELGKGTTFILHIPREQERGHQQDATNGMIE